MTNEITTPPLFLILLLLVLGAIGFLCSWSVIKENGSLPLLRIRTILTLICYCIVVRLGDILLIGGFFKLPEQWLLAIVVYVLLGMCLTAVLPTLIKTRRITIHD